MKNKEKIKKDHPHHFITVCTCVMLVLSAGSFTAKELLSRQKNEKTGFTAEYSHDTSVSYTVTAASPGLNIGARQAIKATSGEGFARFTVEITDIDGVSFTEKLADLQNQLEEVKKYTDPETPSYIAFRQEYHSLLNQYNLICTKYQIAYETLYKATDTSVAEGDALYTAEELEAAKTDGLLTSPGGDGFAESYDEETPYIRTYTYTEPLKAGEECLLFTNIIVPSNWQNQTVDVVQYTENEDHSFTEATVQVSCSEVIGDGFTVNVSAEAVDANGLTSYAAAFSSAQSPNTETALADSSSSI